MSKERATIIAAIITGFFVCVAALIGLGLPIVDRLTDKYFPAVTPTPFMPQVAPTNTLVAPATATTQQVTQQSASVPTPASTVKSRAKMLVIYDSIYREQGWCSLWNKLMEDNLVKGSCPSAVLQWVHENVDTLNGTENLLTGLQMRTTSDIEVSYPACVTFDAANYTGGTVEPWISNDYIGTNLTMHADSVFTLFFRCDNAWSP